MTPACVLKKTIGSGARLPRRPTEAISDDDPKRQRRNSGNRVKTLEKQARLRYYSGATATEIRASAAVFAKEVPAP